MRIRGERLDREDHVQRIHHVVRLREDGVLPVLHGVGRRRHLAVVHDGLRSELAEHALGDRPVAEIPLGVADVLAGDLPPRGDPLRQPGEDRRERIRAGLDVRAAAQVVVDDVDLVAAVREPHRGGPPEVAVAAEDQDAHGVPFSKEGGVRGIVPVGGHPGSRRRHVRPGR